MVLDPEKIAEQQALLDGHRRRLAHLLRQLDTFGSHTPHHIVVDIEQAQAAIRAIKTTLQDADVTVDDEPNDDIDARQVLQRERQARLHALLADHSDFMRDRLASFVGRAHELEEIRARIAALLPTGGYVTITGQAGQGKSSVIAKLVAEYGPENVAHHFIPFNPGPDHQVGLLRNLLARLILKYDLPEFYAASESRPALRDYFPKALAELVAKGGQEVIFIDGLDQLEEEQSGTRDLSFLPPNPPAGVVFVLGTRPNDTLKPLELLKPRHEYRLPDMSRADFDLVLAHRDVTLDTALAGRFYVAMQANALYLDLAAKELAEARAAAPETIIARVADNPDNLFTFAVDRLKRRAAEWYDIIRPTLGLLLSARAPLASRAIRVLLGANDDALRDGLRRLGGLLAQDSAGRYSLYHLKLYEYLRQDEQRPGKDYLFAADEEADWHRRLADWCEGGVGGLSAIWQDARDPVEQTRRAYARDHYIAHLYHAGEWECLWATLDAGEYGRAKIRYDPSTRAYAQDLDMGRQAAARAEWELEEGLALLPNLWRYSLLRCTLASRADNYPEEVFEAMVLLGREQEAIGLAELITKVGQKARVLKCIGEQLAKRRGWEQEGLKVLLRAGDIARTIEEGFERTRVLREVAVALVQASASVEAAATARLIKEADKRVCALCEVAVALAQVGIGVQGDLLLEEATVLARMIERADRQVEALCEVLVALAKTGAGAQGHLLLGEATALVRKIGEADEREWALQELAVALSRAGAGVEALEVMQTIENGYVQDRALCKVAVAQAQIGAGVKALELVWAIKLMSERAKVLREVLVILVRSDADVQTDIVLEKARALARTISMTVEHTAVLGAVAVALAQVGRGVEGHLLLEEATARARTITYGQQHTEVLKEIAIALAQAGASAEALGVARTIENRYERTWALQGVAVALACAGEGAEALAVARLIEENHTRAEVLGKMALTQVGEGAQGNLLLVEAVPAARAIKIGYSRAAALLKIALALAQVGKDLQSRLLLSEALTTARAIEKDDERVRAQQEIAVALVQIGEIEQGRLLLSQALATARTIEKDGERVRAQREIAVALVQIGEIEQGRLLLSQALATARTIEGGIEWAWEVRRVVVGLALAGEDEEALAVVRAIERDGERAAALHDMAVALALAERRKEALAIVHEIKEDYERAKMLQKVTKALPQIGASTEGQTLLAEVKAEISTIEDARAQAYVLGAMAAAMTYDGETDQLLHLIQQSWRETTTRDRLVQLLPMVSGLIKLKPEIGVAFADSFAWVDDFLKG